MTPDTAQLAQQLLFTLIFAIPIACVSWTVTHEEVFAEVHEWLVGRSKRGSNIFVRKAFYLFTCEYCFSHWVTTGALAFTNFRILFDDWRGLIAAGFTLVWIANVYMGLYGRVRLDIRKERSEINQLEQELKQ